MKKNKIYFWNSYEMIHDEVAHEMGFDFSDERFICGYYIPDIKKILYYDYNSNDFERIQKIFNKLKYPEIFGVEKI